MVVRKGRPDFVKVPTVGVSSLRYAGFNLSVETQPCFLLMLNL